MRLGMRYWASGIGIVCAAQGEKRHGMTISSFTSLSIDPPRVLISLDERTRTHALVEETSSFAVTLLAEEQEQISRNFAGAIQDAEDRFAGVEWERSPSGNPVIANGMAYFDCKVIERYSMGQQTAFIAEVVAAGRPSGAKEAAKPLLYFNRDYHQLPD